MLHAGGQPLNFIKAPFYYSYERVAEAFKAINFVGISKMPSGSMLAPHRHFNPNSLVMHVALEVPPEGSGIMVEDETFIWSKPGQYVIFDDSLNHSAWNHGDGERTILHVDFERKVG